MEPRSLRFSSHDLSHHRKQEVQQAPAFSFHDFPTISEQLPSFPEASGFLRFRDVGVTDPILCGSSVISPEMIGFATGNNHSLSSSKQDGVNRSTARSHEDCAFTSLGSYPAAVDDGSWRAHGALIGNFAGGSFIGEVLSKPNLEGFQDQYQFSSSSIDSISEIQSSRPDLYRNDIQGISPAIDAGTDSFHLVQSDVMKPNIPTSFGETSIDSRLLDFRRTSRRNMEAEVSAHGLSLSLSSNPSRIGENLHVSKALDSKASERSLHGVVPPSTYINRNCGPLGPFTGYETILRNSIFMKAAKQLLDEICGFRVGVDGVQFENHNPSLRNSSSLEGGLNAIVEEAETKKNLSLTGGNKMKLVYLHNEVCRMDKQYHHQIQIASSSFGGVAGLGGAAPFVPLALKRISRGFKCVKHAISDQLNQIPDVGGEGIPSAGGGKADGSSSTLKYLDHVERPKLGGSMGYFDLQQHNIWRPQRGLPERAVAILRAWLFEHFLHPYPTDNDKHMLANQTGLSRNQVSNWFINARVRVWKPMVEEIHQLETKGKRETSQASTNEGSSVGPTTSVLSKVLDHPGLRYQVDQLSNPRWPEGQKTKVEAHPSAAMAGSSLSFHPPPANGTVSLTLGLKHGVDYVQNPIHEEELEMVHDIAG